MTTHRLGVVFAAALIGAAGYAAALTIAGNHSSESRPATISTPLPTNCTHYLTAEGTTCAGINGSRQPWEGML